MLGKSIHFYFLRIAAQQKKRLVILLAHQHVRCFWRQTAGNGGPDDGHSERERKEEEEEEECAQCTEIQGRQMRRRKGIFVDP